MTTPSLKKRRKKAALRGPLRAFLVLALTGLALSAVMKRELPPPDRIDGTLLAEPVQTEGEVPPPFEVERKGVRYLVTPLFGYEIRGLVVSEHDSRSFIDLAHKRWNDHLNVKDLCVIWGRNVASGVYRRMTFQNRDFTCYYSYSDAETGGLFSASCISNNHLLAGDALTARAVRRVRRGDQVRVAGWLASYEQPETSFRRGTSTTRADRGDGACETIYVTDCEVLRPGNPGWRSLFRLSALAAAASVAALFLL